MKLTVGRRGEAGSFQESFELEKAGKTLLEMLKEIKTTQDPSLSFRHACGSGICGSCSVRMDGKPVLACTCKPAGNAVLVEPLEGVPVLKDLIVDESTFIQKHQRAKNSLSPKDTMQKPTPQELEKFELQSSCIECAGCYSACPVIKVNPDFLGPFILTKSWRYIADSREEDADGKIEALQQNGVWDCILCGDCATVCPQGINSKMDITFLQTKSSALGHMNPNIGSFGGGFSGGFGGFDGFDGFNPNFS